MKLQKLSWSMLLLLCAMMLQLSCTSMDQGEVATNRSGEQQTSSTQAYWDASSNEIRISFPLESGAVLATVVDAKGQAVYSASLDTAVAEQVIALHQAAAGDYTVSLTDANGKLTSLRFTIL